MTLVAGAKNKRQFDPTTFLATIGEGRTMVAVPKKQSIFTQGEAADAVFYIRTGKVRLTVVSKTGKEATIGILNGRSFFGEGALAGQVLRMGSAVAMTDCELLRVEKKPMMDAAPAWIPRNGHDAQGMPYVVVTCAECLRAFQLPIVEETAGEVLEATMPFSSEHESIHH
jgi:hypothetical protein